MTDGGSLRLQRTAVGHAGSGRGAASRPRHLKTLRRIGAKLDQRAHHVLTQLVAHAVGCSRRWVEQRVSEPVDVAERGATLAQ